jgi:hypothetical protein
MKELLIWSLGWAGSYILSLQSIKISGKLTLALLLVTTICTFGIIISFSKLF